MAPDVCERLLFRLDGILFALALYGMQLGIESGL